MAGLSFAEAIAQGITMGLGQGAQGVIKNRREDELIKKEDERWEARLKKQNEATMGMWKEQEAISAKTRAAETQRSQQFQIEQGKIQFNQQLALENRRELFQRQHLAATSQEARKTAIFNNNLNYIGQNMDKLTAYKNYGKMDIGQVANQLALQAAKAAPTKLQKDVYQDTLKRMSGMSKQEMLGQAGLIPDDLTQFINDPLYKDAIPKGYMAGIQGGQGMDQVFQFTPPAPEQVDINELPKDARESRLREDSYNAMLINDKELQQAVGGYTAIDPTVLGMIDTNLGAGKISPEYTDARGFLNTPMKDLIVRKLGEGALMRAPNGMLTTTAKALADQQTISFSDQQNQLMVPPMLAKQNALGEPLTPPMEAQQATQPGAMGTPMGELPTTSGEAKRASLQSEAAQRGSKQIAKTVNPELTTIEDIDNLKQRMSNLSEPARKAMESLAFDDGGIVGDALRVWRIKAQQDPAAKEAYEFMQYYQAMRNKYAHSQFGASQTAPEMANLLKVTGEGGWKGGADRLMTGLDALSNTGRATIKAALQGQDEASVKAFMDTAPIAQKLLEGDPDYGTESGKAKAELSQTSMNAIQMMPPEVAKVVTQGIQAVASSGDTESIQDTNRLLQMYSDGSVDEATVKEWFANLGV